MANLHGFTNEIFDAPEPETLWPARLVSAIVFLNGLFAILEVVYSRFSIRLENLLPLNYEYFGRLFGLFAGFLLIYFSSQLLRRKQLAWWIAFVGTILIVIDHGLFARDLSALLLPVTSLVLLTMYRDQFRVQSEVASLKQGLKLLLLSIAIALVYGTIGFAKLLPRDFRPPHKITLAEGAVRTVREFTLVGNRDLDPRTREARWFMVSLDALGVVSIGVAFLSLFRPLSYRYGTLPQERARAKEVLEQYGSSSEDAFKLWPEDKSYFFADRRSAFIAYRVERGVALCLGSPVGPIEAWPHMLAQFKRYCHMHDWDFAFLYSTDANVELYGQAGLRPLKIGEDAIIDLTKFSDEVAHNKHFRAVRNKFDRLGYTFEVAEPPQARALLSAALAVTKSWLSIDGRVERSFGLGYHDPEYLRRSRMYLLYDRDRRLVAFANGIRSHKLDQATVDLMRQVANAETGAMDMLFVGILELLHDEGAKEFSLGLAPLTGMGEGPETTLEERAIGYFARLGLGGFSYRGLRRFKSKFEPRWEERFLFFERGPIGLARAAAAIGSVMKGR